jgi:hypothetical protein
MDDDAPFRPSLSRRNRYGCIAVIDWIIIAITKDGFRSIRCVWNVTGYGKGLLVDRPKGVSTNATLATAVLTEDESTKNCAAAAAVATDILMFYCVLIFWFSLLRWYGLCMLSIVCRVACAPNMHGRTFGWASSDDCDVKDLTGGNVARQSDWLTLHDS